ncbi:MAG TPA: hypothetical protein VJ553_07420 [Candidatus Paceibacterota bacterium]|nr:hypothetical protein [Candidatus Paceibacterota bacterium]
MTEGLDRFARFVFADEAGNAIEVDQSFDYSFRVDKSSSRDPDTAEVSIFNLTGTNRAVLATDATTVEVYAGRTAPPKLVFKGEIVDTVSSRTEDMADWDTKITAEDTKSALRTRIVARTFAAGASLHQAIRDLAAAGGVQVDIGVSELKLPSAMSFLAPPRDALWEICKRFGFRYQIIVGRVFVRSEDDPITETAIPLVSAITGLKGVPTADKESGRVKVSFRTMLDAALVPGGLCMLETSTTTGGRKAPIKAKATYWIERVVHTADASGDFTTECVCREA